MLLNSIDMIILGLKFGPYSEVTWQRWDPLLRDLAVLLVGIIAAVKNIDAPMLTRVWQELEYRIDVCRVTRGAHIEHL
jgi:hypothetical protein